jgi:nucleotide-binding universal stress UspA family protein
MKVLPLNGLQSGPPPGAWRHQVLDRRRRQGFALDILVPISGRPEGWLAFDQAELVAHREGSRLLGLHVAASLGSQDSLDIKSEFEARCQSTSVECRFALDIGDITDRICDRVPWSDLVVLKLDHPPSEQPIPRLASGIHTLIRSCTRPILMVPAQRSPMQHALLAYDGSPKAQEALYLASYLAGRWSIDLTLVVVTDGKQPGAAMLQQARQYMDDLQLKYRALVGDGEVVPTILDAAAEHGCDFILMGGYGHRPVIELVLGSTVDHMLRVAELPVLICR